MPPTRPAAAAPPASSGVFAFEMASPNLAPRLAALALRAFGEVALVRLDDVLFAVRVGLPAADPLLLLAADPLLLREPFELRLLEAARDPLERLAVLADRVLPLLLVFVWAIRGSSPP